MEGPVKVLQDSEPLPWGALIDDVLTQTQTRHEAELLGGALMRLRTALRTQWGDGSEEWQGVYRRY